MEQLDQQGRKQGEFKVRLPDGRIQVTSYQAVSVDLYYENLREHSVLNPHKRFPIYYIQYKRIFFLTCNFCFARFK